MGRHDWYRKTYWDKQDEIDFYTRFKKSRGVTNKIQYLKIQALYLEDNQPDIADRLLDEALQYNDNSFKGSCYLHKATVAIKLHKNHEEIISWFRKSIEMNRQPRGIKTTANREYAKYIVDTNTIALFDEAFQALSERPESDIFPDALYERCGIYAIIYYHKGDLPKAKEYAQAAIEYANKTESGFSYHKKIGLVKSRALEFDKRIDEILKR
jgi:tetratricopeptide (TPR) repeat protein